MIGKISGFIGINVKNNGFQINNKMTTAFRIKPMPFDTVSFKSTASKNLSSEKELTYEEKKSLFNDYKVEKTNFGDYEIPVYNEQISEKLKKSYTAQEFGKLFDFAKEKNVFEIKKFGNTGFIRTCESEDKKMGELAWVTDTCNFMPYLKDNEPEHCIKLVNRLSEFYTKQQDAFDKYINDPSEFQKNYGRKECAINGIGHVFNPDNLEIHPHYPRTRLESVGLYLQTATNLIMEGLEGAEYGYKTAEEIPEDTIQAIANCTSYLHAVNYPYTKSTGPWEQWTMDITPSSDVAVINQAFRNVIELMYGDTDNKEVLNVRKRLKSVRKHNEIFNNKEALEGILKKGEDRIKYDSEFEVPEIKNRKEPRKSIFNPQNPDEKKKFEYEEICTVKRELDGAMSFIFKTEKLDDNVVENAKKVMTRMKNWEYGNDNPDGIIRESGMLRYKKDQYLYPNENIADEAHKRERYEDLNLPMGEQAQWFMVSDMSKSYGVVAKSLMEYLKSIPEEDKEAKELLDEAIKKETEFINRSYARITGKNTLKANAKPCPAFKVPEAYQCIEDANGEKKFVAGINTPLTWAQVSLYDASKMMQENLKEYEKLNS